MSVPSDTAQTFDRVGIREDLSNIITNIAPTETPFYTMCRKGSTGSRTPEWQKDGLTAPAPTNANIEGDDATNDALAATERLKNVVQLFDKVAQVSSTAQAVDSAGRANELNYQVAKQSKEIKRDIEMRALGNYASVLGAAGTAGEMAGVEAWLETNTDRDATSGADGGFNSGTGLVVAATDSSADRAISETLLKAVIKSAWESGGEPSVVLASGSQKQAISSFSGIATQYRENMGMKQAKILGAADVYISDFGEHKIVPDRFIGAGTGRSAGGNGLYSGQSVLVLDPSKWEMKSLQGFKVEKLAKTGHSDRRMISTELTLCSMDEAANGVVADLS